MAEGSRSIRNQCHAACNPIRVLQFITHTYHRGNGSINCISWDEQKQTLAEADDQIVLETEHSTHGHTTLQNKIL